jgi:hypothetical protein
MPSKKNNKKRPTAKSAKKVRQRAAKAKVTTKSTKKKTAQKRISSRPRAKSRKKTPSVGAAETEFRREFQNRNLAATGTTIPPQSADFEGLSQEEQADSESVDELVEEGNLFEAGAVAGVEEADNADEREVHTHEIPEDDVPEEYIDKDYNSSHKYPPPKRL